MGDITNIDDVQAKPKRKGNNRQVGFGQENVQPGDNAKYLRYALAAMDLPPIDVSDPIQVEQRIKDYFYFCMDNDRKPNIKGLGNWLGVHRDTVNSWMRGEYRAETHSDLIKKAVDILEELWVDYMLNGKVNPASGIFLGKNMFGYKDVQEVQLTPPQPLGDQLSPEEIAKRVGLPDPAEPIDAEWKE